MPLTSQSASISETFREALRIARLGQWAMNPESGEMAWSSEMYEIWGLNVEDGPPPLEEFFATIPRDESERLRQLSDRAMENGECIEVEHRVLRPDGGVRWVFATAQREPDGRLVGTAQDITERRQLEEQLRQAQKMEAVGRLAGGVAHDFNNILTAIFSYTEFALESMHPSEGTYSDLHEVLRAAERARDLTEQLLAFSRQRTVAPRTVNVNTVVTNLVHMLERALGEDIAVEMHLEPSLWMTTVDPAALEQVVVNLALNARDAMPGGGRLIIESANMKLDQSAGATHAEIVQPGEYVSIIVTDTGSGMSRDVQARIFEPFFTTKPAGEATGLGLSTCYGIVRQAGGYILVYSEVERGSTFRVYLPRTDADDAAAPERPQKAPIEGDESVLVVEDDDQVRTLTVRALTHFGYRAVGAASGDAALELFQAAETPFDLVLTDVVMPGMSGSELAVQISRLGPGTKILFMSGYTEHHVVTRGVLDEGVQLLQKPFTPDRLGRAVRETLDGGTQTTLR